MISTANAMVRAGVVAAIAGLAACGGSTAPAGGNDGGNVSTGGRTPNVTVTNNQFTPRPDTVTAGTTVTWTWTGTGSTAHSVQSTGSGATAFASSATLTGDGSVYQYTFTTPGTYPYNCIVHGAAMSGSIVVQ